MLRTIPIELQYHATHILASFDMVPEKHFLFDLYFQFQGPLATIELDLVVNKLDTILTTLQDIVARLTSLERHVAALRRDSSFNAGSTYLPSTPGMVG